MSDAYNDGFEDGKADVDTQAYFMGVGYGKRQNDVKHIGFKTKEHKDSFVQGAKAHDRHFLSYSTEEPVARPPSLLERLKRLLLGKKKPKRVTVELKPKKSQRKKKRK